MTRGRPVTQPKVRDRIVGAALERFHALGFNACGVQEIVDTAGIPKGSFYNHFKTKESLALEVLALYTAGSKREILGDESIPPLERLRRHFEFLASRYAVIGYGKGCLIGNLAAEMTENTPLLRDAIGQSLARWTALVADAVRDGQAHGGIASGLDAERLARFLVNAWEGAIVRMKIVNSRQPLDDFLAVTFAALLQR